MPPDPPSSPTVVRQIAASAMHAEWTVVYQNPERHERVICFAIRALDDTVVPLIYDSVNRIVRDAGELGTYDLM